MANNLVLQRGEVMSSESEKVVVVTGDPLLTEAQRQLRHELGHLRASWCWIVSLGILLVLSGVLAITWPAFSSLAVVSVLGVILIVAGVATIVGSFWAGKWSGLLVQLLVGILYVVAGVAVTERPLATAALMTFFMAMSFIVLGMFRAVGALIIRFPQWGWALLNGVITFLCGMVIYRHLPLDALWVIGLLVGLEMMFNGWTWIMLGMQIRKLPEEVG
jgi:uncharacterized membrane protein HdeD (DUF308 family)